MSQAARHASGQSVVILAAGHGTRMGGPKAFVRFRGRSFLELILDRCAESGAEVTIAVDPTFRARVQALLQANPVPHAEIEMRWVDVDGRLPMIASLQAALRAGGFGGGFWLWPVDAPFLSGAGWRTLGLAVAAQAEQILKPRVNGRTGHPVWFPGWAVGRIASGDWPAGLQSFLLACDPARIRVLDLPGEFLSDVDTPEELAAAERDARLTGASA